MDCSPSRVAKFSVVQGTSRWPPPRCKWVHLLPLEPLWGSVPFFRWPGYNDAPWALSHSEFVRYYQTGHYHYFYNWVDTRIDLTFGLPEWLSPICQLRSHSGSHPCQWGMIHSSKFFLSTSPRMAFSFLWNGAVTWSLWVCWHPSPGRFREIFSPSTYMKERLLWLWAPWVSGLVKLSLP